MAGDNEPLSPDVLELSEKLHRTNQRNTNLVRGMLRKAQQRIGAGVGPGTPIPQPQPRPENKQFQINTPGATPGELLFSVRRYLNFLDANGHEYPFQREDKTFNKDSGDIPYTVLTHDKTTVTIYSDSAIIKPPSKDIVLFSLNILHQSMPGQPIEVSGDGMSILMELWLSGQISHIPLGPCTMDRLLEIQGHKRLSDHDMPNELFSEKNDNNNLPEQNNNGIYTLDDDETATLSLNSST